MASRWIEVWLLSRGEVPRQCGVYVISANDSRINGPRQVIYVGTTNNLRNRLHGHGIKVRDENIKTRWGVFADVTVKFRHMPNGGRRKLEMQLIRRLKPPGNKAGFFGRSTPRWVATRDEEDS